RVARARVRGGTRAVADVRGAVGRSAPRRERTRLPGRPPRRRLHHVRRGGKLMARHTTCTSVAGAWDGVGGVNIGLGVVGAILLIVAGVTAAVAAFVAAALTPATLAVASWGLVTAGLLGSN